LSRNSRFDETFIVWASDFPENSRSGNLKARPTQDLTGFSEKFHKEITQGSASSLNSFSLLAKEPAKSFKYFIHILIPGYYANLFHYYLFLETALVHSL